MELLQLKYFLHVAEIGHITRAAELLYISQPALSRSLRRLEAELGVPLFKKAGRGICLTEYGQHFYVRVQKIFSELEQDSQERADLLGNHKVPVRIGTSIPGITLPVLESFVEDNINTKITHEAVRNNGELIQRIAGGSLDLGFCDAASFPAIVQHEVLWEDRFYALVPIGDPLAQKKSITIQDLQLHPLILSESEASLRELLESFNGGQLPSGAMSAANMPEALRLSVLGLGMTVTSGFFLEIQIQESMHGKKSLLDFVTPVPIDHCIWNISLIWRRQSYYPADLKRFLAHTTTFYRSRSEQSILQSIIHKEIM